jgi:hypothetical protein
VDSAFASLPEATPGRMVGARPLPSVRFAWFQRKWAFDGRDRGSNRRPNRCQRYEKIHKARCRNHLSLLNVTSNGQLGSRVIVKHRTAEGRGPTGREAGIQSYETKLGQDLSQNGSEMAASYVIDFTVG